MVSLHRVRFIFCCSVGWSRCPKGLIEDTQASARKKRSEAQRAEADSCSSIIQTSVSVFGNFVFRNLAVTGIEIVLLLGFIILSWPMDKFDLKDESKMTRILGPFFRRALF